MQNLSSNIISQEVQEAFKRELGDLASKKPPKGISPDTFVDYLKGRYKNSTDGVLFREGGRHRRASVDGGINWTSLGERHPSKAVNSFTAEQVVRIWTGGGCFVSKFSAAKKLWIRSSGPKKSEG
jgi:hypothetical protein